MISFLRGTLQALLSDFRDRLQPACQVPASAAPPFQMSKLYIPIIPEVEPLSHESLPVTTPHAPGCGCTFRKWPCSSKMEGHLSEPKRPGMEQLGKAQLDILQTLRAPASGSHPDSPLTGRPRFHVQVTGQPFRCPGFGLSSNVSCVLCSQG